MNDLLSGPQPVPPKENGERFPDPVFPRFPDKLSDPGPAMPPERRQWMPGQVFRATRAWLGPYLRSRVLPGDFHPITACLLVEHKCNLDCWYCASYDNKGMTEDIARRSIDWLHDRGGRALALVGGEPLLRPTFIHKVVHYAVKKNMWVNIATNARLLRPELTDRLGDAGAAVFNLAIDSWEEQESLPKAFVPIQDNLEYLLKKQYVYDYMVFFSINICRNNHEDVKRLTEWAHQHRIAIDYHLNEGPLLDQSDHFKHVDDNPTYMRPEDWRSVDQLVDWIVEKSKAGCQMVSSIPRLLEMKTFMRTSSGLDLREFGWNGDGTETGTLDEELRPSLGGVHEQNGDLHLAPWNCRAGQNNVVIRTDGTLAPCFAMSPATFDWGNIEKIRFDYAQLKGMKQACQRHCLSTLNHNLAYCYNDGRVVKWLWQQVKRGFRGGVRSFEQAPYNLGR